MKKLITLLLAVAMLLPAVALADLPDVSGMSDQELKDLIAACSSELMTRSASDPEGIHVFNDGGMRVYQTGEPYFKNGSLYVPVTVCNDLDENAYVTIKDIVCNGWQISGSCGSQVSANAKAKQEMTFKMSDADVTAVGDIISLKFCLGVFSMTNAKQLFNQEEPEEHRFW